MITPHDLIRAERDAAGRREFLQLVAEARRDLEQRAAADPALGAALGEPLRTLAALPARVESPEARVAFVGAVKSGKSTLVNALLGVDLLPRGSGILTAQVTRVRSGPQLQAHLEWREHSAVEREFRDHLRHLGLTTATGLDDPAERQRMDALLAARGGTPSPREAPLRALLRGYADAAPHLGGTTREPLGRDPGRLRHWAARDETAVFVARLEVEVPAPDLPPHLVLMDCQGSDAWNAGHAQSLEGALQEAHRVVYVLSSRVGVREADVRLLDLLRSYGLLPLTRFVWNTDLGELRDAREADRLADGVVARLRQWVEDPVLARFSGLQALLEHLRLLDPASLSQGEGRLLEVWSGAAGGLGTQGLDRFRGFREELFAEAAREAEQWVTRRARAEYRLALLEAARALRRDGGATGRLERNLWESGAADTTLAWVQEQLERTAEAARRQVLDGVARQFRARKAPQRLLWQARIEVLQPMPGAPEDPEALERQLQEVLAATEPLRINAVRNLALEARGALLKEAERLGRELEASLAGAGAGAGGTPPPTGARLAREITVTRPIPLFGRIAQGATDPHAAGSRLAGALGRSTAFLRKRWPGGAAGIDPRFAADLAKHLHRLRASWHAYADRAAEDCLLPHVDEVAAQLYAALASWLLSRIRQPAAPRSTEHLP